VSYARTDREIVFPDTGRFGLCRLCGSVKVGIIIAYRFTTGAPQKGWHAAISHQLACPGFWGTTNHESPRLRTTLCGFAPETGNKSARLRHPAEGRLISPPHLPVRTPEGRYFMATPFIGNHSSKGQSDLPLGRPPGQPRVHKALLGGGGTGYAG